MSHLPLLIALCAAQATHQVGLCASQALPPVLGDNDAPEWIHLLPGGASIETGDARGPYHVTSSDDVIAASFAQDDRLPIDENHSTDLAAPRGEPAPAHGWIVAMEARNNGIWGKVEWTESGRQLVASRAYRGISPVILHDNAKAVHRILRASLTNKPNLRGMATLHQQQDTTMDWMTFLADTLGRPATATEDEIKSALTSAIGKTETMAEDTAAMQSQMSKIGVALGLAEEADGDAILEAATQAAQSDKAAPAEIVALQSEIATLTKTINTMQEGSARTTAETYVDAEIKRGRAGLKPVRERYIALHMKDPAECKALIEAMPVLGATPTSIVPPTATGGRISLNAEQISVARQLGMTTEDYVKQLELDQKEDV
ncbi:phage protease [Cognatiyoonia sp. IB215182]|uniref:phage protease n=1 Tax=Cognatiyoonia sp. IB215182 TaxID=3097353 RepID=UPI002A163C95|nr:phage protease [Cognatiyoonia sp. IB215182]MDX8354350.1 phage protease [Cognatiyoonia sp. IB215182]